MRPSLFSPYGRSGARTRVQPHGWQAQSRIDAHMRAEITGSSASTATRLPIFCCDSERACSTAFAR